MTAAISKALSSLTDVFGFLFNVVVVVIQSFIHSVIHSFSQSFIHSVCHSVIQSVSLLWFVVVVLPAVAITTHHPLHGRHMASANATAVITAPPPPIAVLPPPDTFSFGAVTVPWHATVDDVVQAGRV